MGLSQGKLISTIALRKSIKSFYIIEDIFSLLPKKRKLQIIVYNKKYQEKLNINIEDYKELCIKYIIREGKGKIKEYDKKYKLLYEGEYVNRKRNGKDKEYYYDNSKLEFEGEYLNGERNGKGKEYTKEGVLLFEGEYLNGEINGKGKEYYDSGKLKFEGIDLDYSELIRIRYDKNCGEIYN